MDDALPIDVRTALENIATEEPVTDQSEPATKFDGHTSSRALLDALRDHYIKPGDQWAGGVLLTEVQSPTTLRRADAVYLGFTSSRGYCIDVCELKVTKADFRRELDDPSKAEAWWPHSTRWWIVSPHPSVTPPEELPDGWGLMCPAKRGRRFQVIRKPEVRQPHVDLTLLITLAKKLDTVRENEVRQAVYRAQQEFYAKEAELRRELRSTSDPHAQERLRLLDEMEQAAGLTLRDWSFGDSDDATPQQFGQALRQVVKADRATSDINQRTERLIAACKSTRAHLDELEKAAQRLQRLRPEGGVA